MVIWAPKSMRAGHTIILYYLYWGFFRPVNVLPCTKWLQRSIGNNMNFDKYREHWSQLGAIGVEPTSIVIRVANESLSWSTPSRKSHCRPDTDGTIYLKDWTCWSFGWPEAFHTTRDSQIDGAFSTNQGEKNTSRGVLPCLAVHCPNFLGVFSNNMNLLLFWHLYQFFAVSMEIFTFQTHPALSCPSPPPNAHSCQCHSGTWGFQASPEVEVLNLQQVFYGQLAYP